MLRSLAVAVASLALAPLSFALPLPGDKAPPLSLTEITNAPEGTPKALDEYKGKVVVLEFWATWCGPCVAAIPHLNELNNEFANREKVVFLAITDESPKVTQPLLDNREMRSPIAHDDNGMTFRAYGVRSIPRTIVLNHDGVVAGVLSPLQLTRERLQGYIDGQMDLRQEFDVARREEQRRTYEELSKSVTSMISGTDPLSAVPTVIPEFQVIFRENPYSKGNIVRTTGGTSALGVSPTRAISIVTGVGEACVFLPDNLVADDKKYDLIVSWPGAEEPSESLRLAAAQLAAAAMGCLIEIGEEDVEGYIITRYDTVPLPATVQQPKGWTVSEDALSSEGIHMAPFTHVLGKLTGKVVGNGLGVWEMYELPRIEFEPGNFDSLNDALRESYGMQLEPHTFKSQRVARLIPLED